jgi:Ni,Fe-hydrogenase III small subunit
MVDVRTRPESQPPAPDRTTRTAALWATVVAVPVALLVGLLIFTKIVPATSAAAPSPAVTQPAAVPTAPVQMAVPRLAARPAEVCLAVTSQLPVKVRDLAARKVSAGPEQNAAYGEPALTVACGVTQPKTCASLDDTGTGCVPLDTELMTMNRVCWFADPQAAATVFTTMDREIPVQVTVPKQYAQPAQWANEFSDVVVKTDKSITTGVPTGCA